jgi:hypothetical protein
VNEDEDEDEDAEEGFNEIETQEEVESLLVREGSVKKPDSPEKQGVLFSDTETRWETPLV